LIEVKDNIRYVTPWDGKREVILGYSKYSGISLINATGKRIDPDTYVADGTNPIFQDLNRNGKLDIYEDWRKTAEERAQNLAALMKASPDNVQQIAGLMLYSSHQTNWTSSIPNQAQIAFLVNDDLRHVLIAGSAPAGQMGIHADWNNNIQSIVEGIGFGIPANNSSDPRHGTSTTSNVEYYSANSGVSAWPSSLGLAATFDPKLTKMFGKIASIESRALGSATALSPQIDIATDPRWGRFNGTFGEDPKLASSMARAYVDGFQTTYDNDIDVSNDPETGTWGAQSVNAMIKHWPGGGAGEGGRDAHYNFGKYAVFPGGNFEAHLIPFVDGSLSLEDGTKMATAVMPYYTISYMQTPGSESNATDSSGAKLNMGNSYSTYMINGLLRNAYHFDGVVCTDWNVVGPATSAPGTMFDTDLAGMIWGVDDHYPQFQAIDLDGSYSNMAQRARMLLDAGVDQFGGLNTTAPIVKAYEYASPEDKARLLDQLEMSAYRLLKNIFRTCLFENPYLDRAQSENTIGNSEFMKAGYSAQLRSMVLLKNKNNILASKADVALIFMSSLSSGGGVRDAKAHTNIYNPINLDYKPYTATTARKTSVAGAPLRDSSGAVSGMENRSYRDKTVGPHADAEMQMKRLQAAVASGKPVIVVYDVSNPSVLTDIEPNADVLLVSFQCQKSAILDMLTGLTRFGDAKGQAISIRPTGMLPFQFPKNMEEVEQQLEDVPRDMTPYQDSEGNVYDFGFGLTWENGTTVRIDESVNSGYATFVLNNTTPMTMPENKGDSASVYSILKRMKVCFDFGYKETDTDRHNKNLIKIVKAGNPVTPEAVPSREGYTFIGWYLDDALYDFNIPVEKDIVLVAHWAQKEGMN
jgi:beta-glucosidase